MRETLTGVCIVYTNKCKETGTIFTGTIFDKWMDNIVHTAVRLQKTVLKFLLSPSGVNNAAELYCVTHG